MSDLVKRLRTGLCMLAQEEAADLIEELEAKLAKAVEAMQFWKDAVEPDVDKAIALMDATLAELTGGKDE